jgi:hypothetical protein
MQPQGQAECRPRHGQIRLNGGSAPSATPGGLFLKVRPPTRFWVMQGIRVVTLKPRNQRRETT